MEVAGLPAAGANASQFVALCADFMRPTFAISGRLAYTTVGSGCEKRPASLNYGRLATDAG